MSMHRITSVGTSVAPRAVLLRGVAGILITAASATAQAERPQIAAGDSSNLLLVSLDQGYRLGLDELSVVATALADAPQEVMIAWDRNGHFLTYAIGNDHEVRLSSKLARQLRGGTVIHNHPRGFPPSAKDLDTVLRYGLQRLYVAARINGVAAITDVRRVDAVLQRDLDWPSCEWNAVVSAPDHVFDEGSLVTAARVANALLGVWLS